MKGQHGCQVCGIVPRMFWLFGGTPFWVPVFTSRGIDRYVCPTCAYWAQRILGSCS